MAALIEYVCVVGICFNPFTSILCIGPKSAFWQPWLNMFVWYKMAVVGICFNPYIGLIVRTWNTSSTHVVAVIGIKPNLHACIFLYTLISVGISSAQSSGVIFTMGNMSLSSEEWKKSKKM